MAFYCTTYSDFAVSVKILSSLSLCQTYVSILSFENHLVCDFKMEGMLYFRAGLPLASVFQSQVSCVHSNLWRGKRGCHWLDPDGDRHAKGNLEFAKWEKCLRLKKVADLRWSNSGLIRGGETEVLSGKWVDSFMANRTC